MFLTWRVWESIRFPQKTHPIFRMATRFRLASTQKPNSKRWWLYRLIILLMVIMPLILCVINPLLLVIVLIPVAVLIVLALLLNGTILGSIWLFDITRTLIHFQQSRRYDLMSITPLGAFGASWLTSTGIIHRTNSFKRIAQVYSIGIRTIGIGFVSITAIFWIVSYNNDAGFARPSNQILFAVNIIPVVTIAFAIFIDHVHSITLAVLLGIVGSTLVSFGTSIAPFSVVVFIALQLTTYVISLATFFMLQLALQSVVNQSLFASAGAMLISLLTFYMLREALIGILIRIIKDHFTLSQAELKTTINQQSD